MDDNKKDIQDKITDNVPEDATKYGEFVSSFFAWVSPKDQKNIANKLENITKDKK